MHDLLAGQTCKAMSQAQQRSKARQQAAALPVALRPQQDVGAMAGALWECCHLQASCTSAGHGPLMLRLSMAEQVSSYGSMLAC